MIDKGTGTNGFGTVNNAAAANGDYNVDMVFLHRLNALADMAKDRV